MNQRKGKHGLTRKQKAFADKLIANPKASATEIATQTYNTSTRQTASDIASENLSHPNILKYLDKYGELAEITAVDIMQNSRALKDEPQHASIALRASHDILDRLHGKATQKVETHSTVVTLGLDLTDITPK